MNWPQGLPRSALSGGTIRDLLDWQPIPRNQRTPLARLVNVTFAQARPWIGTAGRLVLAAVWIGAGASKIGDLNASGRAVAAYRLLPFDVAKIVGAVLPFVEIALGLLLLLGLATRLAAIVSAALLTVFIVGIASAWSRGLRIDCGCFGNGGDLTGDEQPRYTSETIRDIALVVVAGFLAVFPRTRLSVDDRLFGDPRLTDTQPDGGPES